MDVWLWISDLPNSTEYDESNAPLIYQLASNSTQSIQLKAARTSESNAEKFITFSIFMQGFHNQKALWVSDMCSLSSEQPFLPLVLQLIQEITHRAPSSSYTTISPPFDDDVQTLTKSTVATAVAWILETHTLESFSNFFNLIFLTRLFWLCACDAPSDVGSLYFHSLLAPNLKFLSHNKHIPVLKKFLSSVGVDLELRITRSVGYMLAKWLILRDMQCGLRSLITPSGTDNLGVSYANEIHNLWVLKGHLPIWSMKCIISPTTTSDKQRSHVMYPFVDAKESALRYALAHQQLEAIIQFEYSVEFNDTCIIVTARVDNFRFHVVKLGYNSNDKNTDDIMSTMLDEEVYFPSRVRVCVGPEGGSTYVSSLSLGRSTNNIEREIEMQKIVKGSFGRMKKSPKIKAIGRTSTRMKIKNWKWDQDVDGNTVTYDATLCDSVNGFEVYAMKPPTGGVAAGGDKDKSGDGLRRRYTGANRPFMKSGGLVFAKDEYGEEVKWRLDKEMEGSVLKWRIGCKVWLSYWPSKVNSSYYETRCIELCDEVDLPLIPSKH